MTFTTSPADNHGSPPSDEGDVGGGASTFCRLAASCSLRTLSTALSRFFPAPPSSARDPAAPALCASNACSSTLPAAAFGAAREATAAEAAREATSPAAPEDDEAAPWAIAKAIGASPSFRCSSVNSDSWNSPACLTRCAKNFSWDTSSASSWRSSSLRCCSRSRASGVLSMYWMYHPLGVLSILHWLVRPKYWTKLLSVTQIVEFMCVWCLLEMKSQYTVFARTRADR
mmetsp:Transcript_28614/g.86465  ORF Transcript_28614/g.86465 Transcript_28614/m.86465 type:complete len:229 (-) Transcript_28614:349-1035(-)